MSVQSWGIVVGVTISALLAMTPWMFMVHAKLAVLSVQMTRLMAKVDKMAQTNDDRLPQWLQQQATLAEHGRQLQTHEVQLSHVAQRLQQIDEEETQ